MATEVVDLYASCKDISTHSHLHMYIRDNITVTDLLYKTTVHFLMTKVQYNQLP